MKGDSGILDTLVLGAGPTGLAAAWRLAGAGVQVQVIDAGPEPGGLCRTLSWGPLRFDVGGHRFHTAFPDVAALVEGVAGDELRTVARRSRLHLGGRRFLPFPPTVGDTLAQVPLVGLRAGLHNLVGALVGVDPEPPPDLRQYLRRQFGDALYALVFEEYTARVWGLRPEQISPDWGAARVGGLSLGGLLRQALGLAPGGVRTVETFRYPAGGYGRIMTRLAQAVEERGGVVSCGLTVRAIHTPDQGPVEVVCEGSAGPVRLRARRVLSTMPLAAMALQVQPPLSEAAQQACRSLRYRALVLVVLDLEGDAPLSEDTWLYFPHASTPFCRLHEPTNWSRELAPPGRSHVVVEYFCEEGDPTWRATDQALADEVGRGLAAAGLLDPSRLAGHHVLRFPRAYPIYDAGYATTLARVEAELDQRPDLHRAGRAGAFLYLSSDECLRHGLVAAEALLTEGEEVRVQPPGMQVPPESVEALRRALRRRAADVATGVLAGQDGRALLARQDQLRASERRPWAGLALVRRGAWLAAGGQGVDPTGPQAAEVLARLAADPARVLVREPRAEATAPAAWWAALPRGPARGSALGVEPPGWRRRLAGLALWGTLICAPWSPPLALLAAGSWLLASLPDWVTLVRARRPSAALTLLSRGLRLG